MKWSVSPFSCYNFMGRSLSLKKSVHRFLTRFGRRFTLTCPSSITSKKSPFEVRYSQSNSSSDESCEGYRRGYMRKTLLTLLATIGCLASSNSTRGKENDHSSASKEMAHVRVGMGRDWEQKNDFE